MANLFSFSEDMLPRHFPRAHLAKSAKQTDETAVAVPQATLPNVSLLFSNERSARPQQPIQKWEGPQDVGQRNDSIEAKSAAKSKKHVKFDTASLNVGRRDLNERKLPNRAPTLELSYLESQRENNLRLNHRSPLEKNCRPYDRTSSSDSMKENGFTTELSFMPHDNQHQLHGNKTNGIAHHKAINNVGFTSHGMMCDQRNHSYDETLLDILEEQQHYIKVQKKLILEQEIRNMEQQKQIYILQRQVQQLLYQNEDIESQLSERKFLIENRMTKNTTPHSMNLECGMSELVKDDDDEINATKIGLDKTMPFIGFSSEINSTAMFNYKINELVSANRHSDISITAQAFICETSQTSSHEFTNSQLAAERSFVLNKLGMKYKCSEDDRSLGIGQRNFRYNQSNRNDQISELVASDMHDYLVRHGLIKR